MEMSGETKSIRKEVIKMGFDIKFNFDSDKIKNAALDAAKKNISSGGVIAECPHCHAKIHVTPGKVTCPSCGKQIDVKLNF
jgi:Zn finger protein HypA/HybF involved in hydrogenase expression